VRGRYEEAMNIQEIEIANLDQRYGHLRLAGRTALNALADSIERFGQKAPVLVLRDEGNALVLLDGYQRVKALQRLRRDTVMAEVREGDEADALALLLSRSQERPRCAVEQAFLIKDLLGRFGWSVKQVAHRLGRDSSWVSHRLALVNDLPDDVLEAVRQGHFSIWAGSRVLAPLARANSEHASRLVQALRGEKLGTRELTSFLKHYEQANPAVRERMVNEPLLFAKVSGKDAAVPVVLRQGPQGAWLDDLRAVSSILRRLRRDVDRVFYPGQSEDERADMQQALTKAQSQLLELQVEITEVIHVYDYGRDAKCDTDTHGEGVEDQGDMQDARPLAQHRAQCAAGQTARPGQQREHWPGNSAFDQGASWPLPWESRASP